MRFLIIIALQVLSLYGQADLCDPSDIATVPMVSGETCDRECDGTRLNCVFYLTMERYVTAGQNCGNCSDGNYEDCRQPLCVPGDGSVRMIIAFNGTVPGPPIVACQNDVITIHLTCSIDPETCSLHSHGMRQKGCNGADGVPWVTQFPFYSGHPAIYRFVATESGTHWYHSHSGSQRADGAFGHMIIRKIYSVEEYFVYDVDDVDHSISLLEWFPKMSPEYLNAYQRQQPTTFYNVNITGIMVNGHVAWPNNGVLPYRIVVQAGKSYRIRVIHAGNIVCPIEMSIKGHSMMAFQSDGSDFRRQEFNTITLTNGERYDFVLLADQPPGVYSIKFRGGLVCQDKVGVAELVYCGSTGKATHDWRDSNYGTGKRLNCVFNHDNSCVAIHELEALKPEVWSPTSNPQFIAMNQEKTTLLRFRNGAISEDVYTPFLNNISYVPPQIPFDFETPPHLCNNEKRLNCSGPYCECTHAIQIPLYSVVDIIMYDMGTYVDLAHPMHIHGYKMSILCVIKLGTAVTPQVIETMYYNDQLYEKCNMQTPLAKDTVQVPDGGYTIARVYFDNPGSWFFHCHVDFHTEEGMALTIMVS